MIATLIEKWRHFNRIAFPSWSLSRFGLIKECLAADILMCHSELNQVHSSQLLGLEWTGEKLFTVSSYTEDISPAWSRHGPLIRYVKLAVAHAPGMPGMFSPPPTTRETASKRSRNALRHVRHARAVMHIRIANPRWRGKRSQPSRRMRNPQFYVSDKRPMVARPCSVMWSVKLSY